jgi:hypothetical protein
MRFGPSENSGAVPGTFTRMCLIVDDIAGAVQELIAKRLHFEEYYTKNLRTTDGVADADVVEGAWFKKS